MSLQLNWRALALLHSLFSYSPVTFRPSEGANAPVKVPDLRASNFSMFTTAGNYLAFGGTENGFITLPLQFQETPVSITLSLWTLASGSQVNTSSLLFFVGPEVINGTQPGWGIQRTALSGRDGSLHLVQMSPNGILNTIPLRTNLALNDWSYLSVVLSRIDTVTNRTSISTYINALISSTITTELNWIWTDSPKQYIFAGGSLERAVPNWYGGIFRVSVFSAIAGSEELAELMRGIRPETINDGVVHVWNIDESSPSAVTSDSVTGVSVSVAKPGVAWAFMDTCGDSILEGWEQCDTAVGLNCTHACSCAPGTYPTNPPSIDCSLIRPPSVTMLPAVETPSLEKESKQLTWKVLLAVWAIALGGAAAYFVASKFWRRYLPPKVPTAVIVRVGTENDLRLLELGERMDDKRAAELLKTDLQTTKELYSDIDEEELAKKSAPPAGTLAKTWASESDHSSRERNLQHISRTLSLGGTPKTTRRRMEDLEDSDGEIVRDKFGSYDDDGDDVAVSLDGVGEDDDEPQFIRSAPVSPVPRRHSDPILNDIM